MIRGSAECRVCGMCAEYLLWWEQKGRNEEALDDS